MAIASEIRNPLLRSALWYARHGWHVFPVAWPVPTDTGFRCNCGAGKDCERPAKHPWGKLAPRGLRDATAHEGEVRQIWGSLAPWAGIGLVCGKVSGIWVLDVDAAKDGFGSLEQLAKDVGGLPDTLTVETGGGGLHLYFQHPGRKVVTRTSSLGSGLDVRGDGGYVLASPSRHVSGHRYRVTRSMMPVCAPMALLERVMAPVEPLPPPVAARPRFGAAPAVRERARRYLATLPASISGSGGHRAAFLAALHLVKGFELPDGDALELLEQDFNPRCQPRWSRSELQHKVESASRSDARSGYLLAKGVRAS